MSLRGVKLAERVEHGINVQRYSLVFPGNRYGQSIRSQALQLLAKAEKEEVITAILLEASRKNCGTRSMRILHVAAETRRGELRSRALRDTSRLITLDEAIQSRPVANPRQRRRSLGGR